MARTVVPLIGQEYMQRSPGLLERVTAIVQNDFGHTLKALDAGSVFELANLSPLKAKIPFVIEVEGAVEPSLSQDWLSAVRSKFPSSAYLRQKADYIPVALKEKAVDLSLGHVNGAPEIIRKAVRAIYEHLSDSNFRIPDLGALLAVSKSTLERACEKNGLKGAGHLLTRIRMDEAKRMVLETHEPINAIAIAVGYDSLASFDRRFAAEWKCSPNQMRQNAKSVSQIAKLSRNANK